MEKSDYGLSCTCPGYTFRKTCKHINYCEDVLKDSRTGKYFSEINDIPTYQESVEMDWGNDKEKYRAWVEKHIKIVEL